MKKGIVPGVILAIIGVVLFAYEGFGASVRTGADVNVGHRAQFVGGIASNDQSFPAASVLAGILFMSGVGLAAISANPSLQSRSENNETLAASSGHDGRPGRY